MIIEPTAKIRGINGFAERIAIGDNTYIGHHVEIICNDFEIGDYCKVHHHTNVHGYQKCKIGHNAWIGQYCILDCIGGLTIGNNCGVGAHSQLWSHIKYGDTLEGCQYLSEKEMKIGNDVWFVGHCIVSPITAEDKSMALVGSVITGDMSFNSIYAGVPAKNITEKVGHPFKDIDQTSKFHQLKQHLVESKIDKSKIQIVMNNSDFYWDDEVSYFSIADRQYTKKRSIEEIAFMNYLLPEKAKFTPVDPI
ncbi:MAG: hypothetical protein RJQ09_11900 [Cyclobacteriaceae bacterium]